MTLKQLFIPLTNDIQESREPTAEGMTRLIHGAPRIIGRYAYGICAPQLGEEIIAGDGFCDFHEQDITIDSERIPTLQIGYIAVDPQSRDRGIGTLLSRYVMERARYDGRHLSFRFPLGCDGVVQRLARTEHEVLRYDDSSDFGYFIRLRDPRERPFDRNVVLPDVSDWYSVPM